MLTEYEQRKLLPVLLRELPNHKGKKAALKIKDIAQGLNRWAEVKVTEFVVIKLLEEIILGQMLSGVIIDGKHVYLATNLAEIQLYMGRLDAKIKHLCCIRERVKQQLNGYA